MSKKSTQEVYELLSQQKKLQEMRKKLFKVLDTVNQAINSITVEDLELRSNEIEEIQKIEEEEVSVIQYDPIQQDKRAEEINQQIIDLELKFHGNETDTEAEEEFDDL